MGDSMKEKEEFLGVKKCIIDAMINILSRIFGIDTGEVKKYFEEQKIKISKTPNPKLGDLGIPLHYLFVKKNIDRREWSRYGENIVEELLESPYRDKCFLEKAEFINGYLNIWINYAKLLDKLVDEILRGRIDEKLTSIGKGVKVIVEHTSANPIHPLHIGSGRNAVIGSTYANLLRRLGYSVDERFYVDDMGRQVAIMIHGYKILRENNVEPPRDIKIDHWFGAIYALTNILIEKRKLIQQLNQLDKEFYERINEELSRIKIEELNKNLILLRIYVILKNLSEKKPFIHRYDEELSRLKKLINKLRGETEKISDDKIKREISEYLKLLEKYTTKFTELIDELKQYSESEFRLASLFPETYNVLSRKITDPVKAEELIDELIEKYEEGDTYISKLFREAAEKVLEGFKETLRSINVVFNGYDWESDPRILEYTRMVIDKAVKLPYTIVEGKAVIVDLDQAAREHEYIKKLFGEDQPGKVVLRRSDGTTLYVTRDIAYSIYKFKDLGADKVYNVIAHEQDREQKQVKAILYLLGYQDLAERLIHLDYEMVHLKGRSMSGRRGIYYTIDELLRDYIKTIIHDYLENAMRTSGRQIDYKYLEEIAGKLAVTNTRILLSSIDPRKILVFNPDKLGDYLNGSWLTYTLVRIQGILRKYFNFEPLDNVEELKRKTIEIHGELKKNETYMDLSIEERSILEKISEYPETLVNAMEYMEPNKLVEYLNELALLLNRFYEKHSVIGEKNEYKRKTRIILIVLCLLIMKDLFKILKLPMIKRI